MRRGLTASSAALAAILSAQTITAAPAGLAATVSAAVLAGTTASSGGLTLTALKLMSMGKLKTAVGTLMVAGLGTTLVLEHQALVKLREQNAALGQRLDQLHQLEAENLRLYQLVVELSSDKPDRLHDEIARLRVESERLRAHKEEWEALCAENRQLRSELGDTGRPPLLQEAWTYVGYGDPESACQSHFWASVSGDPKAFLDSLCPEARASWGQCSEEEIATAFAKNEKVTRKIPSYQILGQKKISDDEIELIVNLYPDRPDIENFRPSFKRVGSEWKLYGHFHHFLIER